LAPKAECHFRTFGGRGILWGDLGADKHELWDLFPSLEGEDDYIAMWAFTVCAHMPEDIGVDYPAACIMGEQGSAKSSVARGLVGITDPAERGEFPMIEDIRDLPPITNNSRVVLFGNTGLIKEEMADRFCIVVTGGTIPARAMRTNGELDLFPVHNPMIFNSTIDPIPFKRNDFRDRVLYIRTKVIEVADKRMKKTVKDAFEEATRRLFGQACLAIQRAMKNLAKSRQLIEGREDLRLMDAAVVIVGGLEGNLGLGVWGSTERSTGLSLVALVAQGA
jgi:hypothetical protein